MQRDSRTNSLQVPGSISHSCGSMFLKVAGGRSVGAARIGMSVGMRGALRSKSIVHRAALKGDCG